MNVSSLRPPRLLALGVLAAALAVSPATTAQGTDGPLAPQSTTAPAPAPAGGAPLDLPAITPGPTVTLAEVLASTDRRNLSLEAARVEIEKADAQLGLAYAAIFPAAQGTMTYTYKDHEDAVDFGGMNMVISPQDDLKGALQASLPLVAAQSWATIAMARTGVELANLSIANVRQKLLAGTTQTYFVALMSKEVISSYESQVRAAHHHLEVARARLDAGAGLKIDVVRAETDLSQARQELLAAHTAFDNARDALALLAGFDGLPIPADTRLDRAPAGDEAALVDQAGRKRLDLATREASVRLAEAALDASWMQFLPTLNAAWQLQYQFSELGGLGSDDRSRWAAVLSLTVPIYNQFRYADLDLKRANVKAARLQQDDAARNLTVEVRKALRDWQNSVSLVTIAERQSELAAEAMQLIDASFEAGTGSSLDVTDALRTKKAADVNLVAQRLKAQIALVTLLQAVGEDMGELAGPRRP